MTEITIHLIALIQAAFAAYVLYNMKKRSSSTSILAFFVLIICINLSINTLKIIFPESLSQFCPLNAWIFAYGPMLFLYLRSSLLKAPANSILSLVHFIPFLFFFSLSLVLRDKTFIFNIQGFKTTATGNSLLIVYCSLAYLSVLIYSILCWTNIGIAKKNIEDYYSFDKAKKMVQWFKFITLAFFIVFTIPTLIGIMSVVSKNDTFDTNIIYIYGFAIICYCIVYYIINFPEVFIGDETDTPLEISTINKKTGYSKSQLPKETLDRCADKLIKLMENEKLFLQIDLSLDDVAKMLGYPRHYITQALNTTLNKNFYLFVNEYRIKEFKDKVVDKQYDNKTLLSLAYDSGFNSKSTFNSIFKKFTGQTPTEYADEARRKRDKNVF